MSDDVRPVIPDDAAENLTHLQAAFVQHMLTAPSAVEAYRLAGGKATTDASARQQAHRLMTDGDVQKALAVARTELARTTKVNAEAVVTALWEEATDRLAGTPASRVSALTQLAKHFGLFEKHNTQKTVGDPAAEAERIRKRLAERGIDVDRLFPRTTVQPTEQTPAPQLPSVPQPEPIVVDLPPPAPPPPPAPKPPDPRDPYYVRFGPK